MATCFFTCSKCGESFGGDDSCCGSEVKCPHCGNKIVVPKRPKIILLKKGNACDHTMNQSSNPRMLVRIALNKLIDIWRKGIKGKVILCSFPLIVSCLGLIAYEKALVRDGTPEKKVVDNQSLSREIHLKQDTARSSSIPSRHDIDKPTKEFVGVLHSVDVAANAVIILDIEKWCFQRKVRLDKIKLNRDRNVRQYISNRWGSGKLRVTYKDIEDGFINGTIWAGAGSGESENEIFVKEGYATYDD